MGGERLDTWCAVYAPALVNPPPAGPGVCRTCHGPAPAGTRECRSCRRMPRCLDVVLPISLSVAGGPLHRALRGYKDDPLEVVRVESAAGIEAVLGRFLREHERCVAAAAGAGRFDLVTAVPERPTRRHAPLAALIRGCDATAERYAALLAPGSAAAPARRFARGRFRADALLHGESVLLVDDTWTSGASAQSAAYALKRAGARRVGLVVVGRHVAADAGGAALEGGASSFRWGWCAAHHA